MKLWGNSKSDNNFRKDLEKKLDKVLFHWDVIEEGAGGGWIKGEKEPVNIARLLRGTQIFGGTGSGKSSGSGKTIAKAFLKSGFGGLVLCAKPDERKTWEKYARETEQEHRLEVFNVESGLQFNPILYEATRGGEGAGETLNLVELIMNIHLLGQNYMSGGGGGSEPFWESALRRCLSRSIDLLKLSERPINMVNMRKIMVSALTKDDAKNYEKTRNERRQIKKQIADEKDPNKKEHLEVSFHKLGSKITNFRKNNYCLDCVLKAASLVKEQTDREKNTYQLVRDYFFREFANLSERTRSVVEEFFYGLAEPFVLDGILKNQFSDKVSPELKPEKCYEENKIIIVDFDVKNFLLSGIYAQGIYSA